MRNILLLILRFKNFLAYLGLSLVAISLMVNFNHLQRSNWLHSAGAVTGSINAGTSGISSYFFLKTENAHLAQENARLQQEILTIKKDKEERFFKNHLITDTLSEDSTRILIGNLNDYINLNDSVHKFIPAVVVNNSVNSSTNFITINKGKNNGVSIDDGVVTVSGIVGRVVSTSDNFSLVKSVLHINNPISIILKKQNELGDLVWNGEKGNQAQIKNIPRHTTVSVGDSILTSGYGTVYPPKHFVGLISEAVLPENDAFYNLKINLAVNYNSIKHVYVYKNLLANEIRNLNAQTDTIP